MQETWVQSQGWEDPLEEGTATHSIILAWRIPMDRGAWRAAVQRIHTHQRLLLIPASSPTHKTLATINLCILMDLSVLDTSYKWDHKMQYLVTNFCHLAQHFQCPAILQAALVFHSFYY